jgi:hypothetical protein
MTAILYGAFEGVRSIDVPVRPIVGFFGGLAVALYVLPALRGPLRFDQCAVTAVIGKSFPAG